MIRIFFFTMFLLLLLLVGGTYSCTREELELVQIISVPGAHAPAFVYPEDPNPESTWKEGLDDLTMLGKYQAYAMGVFLRDFYDDFINSDPTTLEVMSSSDKGTVKSAQSLVTALFSPTPYWEVVQNFSWQPIYIKYDNEEDKFLSSRIHECPSATVDLIRIILSESEALAQTYQSLMLQWSMDSGMELKNVIDVARLYSVLHTQLLHNLTIPEWSRHHWHEMKFLFDATQSLRAKSQKAVRLFGGPLLHRTIEAMRKKAINGDDPKKVIVYLSNANPLFNFLQAMDIGKAEYLPPCTTVLVELYKHEDAHFVRYLYVNSTMLPEKETQEVYSLTVPGCTEFCPLNYINEYTKNIIPKNWEQECLFA